jgi:alcohol dehydrogenase (cytochrome c)
MGPSILAGIVNRNDVQLAMLVQEGTGAMPGLTIPAVEMAQITAHLRSLQGPQPVVPTPGAAPAVPAAGRGGRGGGGGAPRPLVREKITLIDGKTLEGGVTGEGFSDKQMRTDDGKLHILRRVGDKYREVTSTVDWPIVNGDYSGNRFTKMTQITKLNVGRMGAKWTYQIAPAGNLQGTPVVADGVMYVTNVNTVLALDPGTGRLIWRWNRATTPGTLSASSNRGVAVSGDRVFVHTDAAHIVALNRHTGEQLWDTEMADYRQNYFATGAPLTVGNLVLGGVGGGESGTRGFVGAYDQATGKEIWRFWTIPAKGEPGSETWENGRDIEHGGAPTWIVGTYDPATDTVYWPTGNPAKSYNGDDRPGDNLYTCSVVALDAKTGKLKWHFQFTPHDLWDWDATETPVLVDANWGGQPRKLLLQANRNGFFYVLDRITGKFLLGSPFVKQITWASGFTPEGRPIKLPNQNPSPEGTRVCPSQDGATNWYSPTYLPSTGLFYFQAFESCSIYVKRDQPNWVAGTNYLGGVQRNDGSKRTHYLKAMNIQTGKIVWEVEQPGGARSWGGTLGTATGIVFFAEENGAMMAADGITGKPLWRFETNLLWKASPMAYMFDGKQYLAAIAGGTVYAFALPD